MRRMWGADCDRNHIRPGGNDPVADSCQIQRAVSRINSRTPASVAIEIGGRGHRRQKMEFAMHETITNARNEVQRAAREKAYATPLSEFHPGNPDLFHSDSFWPYFDRLRKEEPVHYCKDSIFGPYGSVTKYNDIMDIETNHSVFSSAASLDGITIRDPSPDLRRESFIAMDQPRHSAQRKADCNGRRATG